MESTVGKSQENIIVSINNPDSQLNAMSGNSIGPPETFKEERIEMLLDHSDLINENYEEIEVIFEDIFNNERKANNWDDFLGTLQVGLYEDIDETHSLEDLASGLLNLVGNWSVDVHEQIKNDDEELATNLRKLASQYGLPTQRRANRINQGRDYWNNIKTSTVIRASNPVHRHELTIDYETIRPFDSSINGTVILSRHFLQQVADYPDIIGEDVISVVDRSEIEEIKELSEEILDIIDNQEEIISSDSASNNPPDSDE